jgi:tripartite-type tricarboxylate transporter receptor subunit TctC
VALTRALEVETVRQNLSVQGVIYRLSSPEELGPFIETEVARWARVVKDNRIIDQRGRLMRQEPAGKWSAARR